MEREEIRGVIEALLYMSDEPLKVEDVSKLLKIPPSTILEEIKVLEKKYNDKSGVVLKRVAEGYMFKSNHKYQPYLKEFIKNLPKMKLSMAALETLAIIAYKQPITIPEILKIRGVKSTGAIKTLMEKKLIVPRGRKKVLGKPMMYGTSKEFLIHFGLNSIEDLPKEEEIKNLLNFGSEEEEKIEVKNSENNS